MTEEHDGWWLDLLLFLLVLIGMLAKHRPRDEFDD